MNPIGSTRTSGVVGSNLLALCRFVGIFHSLLLAIGGFGPTDILASERSSSEPKSSFEVNTTAVSIAPYSPGSGISNGVSSGDMRAPSLIIAVPLQIDENSSTWNPVPPVFPPAVQQLVPQSLTAEQIGRIARQQSKLSQLLCREASAIGEYAQKHRGHSHELARKFLERNAARLAQQSAEQAMLLHSGLYALDEGRPLLKQSLEGIDAAIEQQKRAVEEGIPIADPTRLFTHRIEALDRQASNELLSSKVRIQLALLIPSDIACNYHPLEMIVPVEIPKDICAEIHQAYQRRCDLVALRELANQLTFEDLELARLAAGQLAGRTLALVTKKTIFGSILRIGKQKEEEEFCVRKRQISDAADLLEKQIAIQIELDWQEWRTAAYRWELAKQQVEMRQQRVEQLKRMGELGRPAPVELLSAQAEHIVTKGSVIERANDLRQAYIRYLSSTGQL